MKSIDYPFRLTEILTQVRWIHEWNRPSDFFVDRLSLPYTLFWYILSGSKKMIINDQEFQANRGDFLIIPPHVPFTVVAKSMDQTFHYLALVGELKIGLFDMAFTYQFPHISHFEPGSLSDLLQLWHHLIKQVDTIVEIHKNKLGFSLSDMEAAEQVFETIDTELLSQYFQLNARLNLWLVEIFRVFNPILPHERFLLDSRLEKVCTFIKRNFREKLNLKSLAQQAHISESHLRYMFRNRLGISPMNYVRKHRINRARELLLTTQLPLSEIAEMSGFTDQSQFNKTFRSIEGVSPQVYRRQSKHLKE